MEYSTLGRTGLQVSVIGFGGGNVGGLMIRGAEAEQRRAVSRAIEHGINYFDTAPMYGEGLSETNLGRVLGELGADVHVGTKVRLSRDDMADASAAIRRSLETSLGRLQRDFVDLLQLHNPVTSQPDAEQGSVTLDDVRGPIAEGLHVVREAGLTRHLGFTGLGEPSALHEVVATGLFDTVQAYFNVINPSAGYRVGPGFVGQDFRQLIDVASAQNMGVLAIRIMAAGALSAEEMRHPIASTTTGNLTPGTTYETDLTRAQRLQSFARSLGMEGAAELAVRFAISKPGVSTVLVGFSDTEQIEQAVRWASAGLLSHDVLQKLSEGRYAAEQAI